MPSSRASASGLAKLLESVPEPVYAVDEQRRIRFFNSACRAWVGAAADGLLGAVCHYHSSPDVNGAAAVAAALCPPPEAFLGRSVTATIVLPLAELPGDARRVEFVPLAGEGPPAGVMAFVCAPPPPEAEPSAAEDPADQLHARLQRYRRQLKLRYHVDRLWGDSPAMRRVRSQVRLAASAATSVVVVGADGSGRQHVARAIHYGADRATAGTLVPLACALLDSDLLRASLRALARTKATAQQPASLLLEDADQLSEAAQADLAGLLSAGEFPARVISTATLSPVDLAAWGRFRHDLACLLSSVLIQLPPLAERLEDLPLVAQGYLEQANARGAKQSAGFTPEALDCLAAYAWPGDLDELEKCVAESHARAKGPLVTPGDLPPRLHLAADAAAHPRKPDEPIKLEEFLAKIERELIERALRRSKGNKAKAARLLGMTRPRLYRRLVQLGLETEG